MSRKIEKNFVQVSKSWYRNAAFANNDKMEEFLLTVIVDGKALGQFSISWLPVNGILTPKLEAWDDTWEALGYFPELLAFMSRANDKKMDPDVFAQHLRGLGIKDVTCTEPSIDEDWEKPHTLTLFAGKYKHLIQAWPFKPNEANIEDALKRESLKNEPLFPQELDIDYNDLIKYGKTRSSDNFCFYLNKIEATH